MGRMLRADPANGSPIFSDVENLARCRAETIPGSLADVLGLVELLRMLFRGEVAVDHAASCAGAVRCAAVPEVRVDDHYAARRRGEHELFGVGGLRIGEHFLRGLCS